MEESEGCFCGVVELLPVGACGFEEVECSDDIGLDEIAWAVDGAIDVGFCGEVDDGVGFVGGEDVVEEGSIPDVAVEEEVIGVALEVTKVCWVTGVGESVEVEDAALAEVDPVEDKVGADEAGAAGDKESGGVHGFWGRLVGSVIEGNTECVTRAVLAVLPSWTGWTCECFDLERADAIHIFRSLVLSVGDGGSADFGGPVFFE
jgi:hypothetical protein